MRKDIFVMILHEIKIYHIMLDNLSIIFFIIPKTAFMKILLYFIHSLQVTSNTRRFVLYGSFDIAAWKIR